MIYLLQMPILLFVYQYPCTYISRAIKLTTYLYKHIMGHVFFFAHNLLCSWLKLVEEPVTFTIPLQDQTVTENESVAMTCQLSKPDRKVVWTKDGTDISQDDHYSIEMAGVEHTLRIPQSVVEDSAEFTAKIGDQSTSGTLTVEGRLALLYFARYSSLFKIVFQCFFVNNYKCSCFILVYITQMAFSALPCFLEQIHNCK